MRQTAKISVLTIAGGYFPGYRYGGPVRSLSALVEQLSDEIDFSVVTSNHDLGESTPYDGIESDSWTRVGKADVWYGSSKRLSPLFWRKIMADRKPDVVYLNSFMAPATAAFLLWRKVRLIPQVPVVLAPRGEFAPSALNVKSRKKVLFRRFAKVFRLYQGITWQASAPSEEADIRREQPDASKIIVAPALTTFIGAKVEHKLKEAGRSRFVWTGRIASVKNLEGVFEYLGSVAQGSAHLEVYGPIEDQQYWQRALGVASTMPGNVTYLYCGEISHDQIPDVLQRSHFFLSPSRGENFGHTIAEALNQGLPVIISDQTPWRNLEAAGVGWDIPLADTERWQQVIQKCIDMDDREYQAMSARCRGYVDIWMDEHGGKQASLEMFQKVFTAAEVSEDSGSPKNI